MAWRKEQKEAIEALEDAEAILRKCQLTVSRKWNMADEEMSRFCEQLDRDLSRVAALLIKTRSSGHPGGREYDAALVSRKSVLEDIQFALRRLQERKYEGSLIDAEAVTRLERALEKLGVGDG